MTKHLSSKELAFARLLHGQGRSLQNIQRRLRARRRGGDVPHVNNLRNALRGRTYNGNQERRGRKPCLTVMQQRRLDTIRKQLQRKHPKCEITLAWLEKESRLKVSLSSIARALRKQGVQWRPAREKPHRSDLQEQQRLRW
jgi:transposase